MEIKYLDIIDIIYIYNEVVFNKYKFDQKTPRLNQYDHSHLIQVIEAIKSITELPRQTAFGKEVYDSLLDKGVILFLTLTKNHIFINGNKRTAVYSLFLFMWCNCYWLNFKHLELYRLSEEIASRDPRKIGFDEEKKRLSKIIGKRLVKIEMNDKVFLQLRKNKGWFHNFFEKFLKDSE